MLVGDIEGAGFNVGIFDTAIPIAAHVDRATTATAQVAQLLSSGNTFSASEQWNHCKSRIGNAGVTLQTQKEQLQLNETARTKVANKNSEAQLKTLERAQAALAKHEINAGSLTEKDWGKTVRRKLPEAEVILAKFATLPNNRTTYIPHIEVDPVIPPTQIKEQVSEQQFSVDGLDCNLDNRPRTRIMEMRALITKSRKISDASNNRKLKFLRIGTAFLTMQPHSQLTLYQHLRAMRARKINGLTKGFDLLHK